MADAQFFTIGAIQKLDDSTGNTCLTCTRSEHTDLAGINQQPLHYVQTHGKLFLIWHQSWLVLEIVRRPSPQSQNHRVLEKVSSELPHVLSHFLDDLILSLLLIESLLTAFTLLIFSTGALEYVFVEAHQISCHFGHSLFHILCEQVSLIDLISLGCCDR